MEKITSIQELIDHLGECSEEQFKDVYKLIDIPIEQYSPYLFWSSECYTRNCISRTEKYELILLCWEKNQYTQIHAHNNQECWVYNVQGSFEEIRFLCDDNNTIHQVNKLELKEQDQSHMNDYKGLHILRNNFNDRSISLHLYAEPINECVVYNELNKQFETKMLSYHSVEGRLVDLIKV